MLKRSELAPGLLLEDGVDIGADVEFGGNVVVRASTRIASGCRIGDGAVLGKQPVLAPHSSAKQRGSPQPLTLDEGVAVGTGAVLFAGAHVCAAAIVGDQVHLRERSEVGPQTVIGRGCAIDNDVVLGARVSVQSNCYLTAWTVVEDDVFVAPGVVTTNDNTMRRHGPSMKLSGAILRRACRVGAAVVLAPGVEVGEEAFIAAGAVVTTTVPSRAVVMGVPGRAVREVGEEDLLERWR